jgi:heme/copper-type cytochrome/quinol oxidase subunit 2
MTILIPCGVTQAMMILAVSTKSAALGAAIMAAFTIGTSPIFFALGMTINEFLKRKALSYAAVSVIVILGALSINTGQALRGSVHTFQNYYKVAVGQADDTVYAKGQVAGINSQGKQEATINVTKYGYTTDVTTLKAGVPVSLNLVTNNAQGCTRAFAIPSLNISKILPISGFETLEFTPKEAGKLTFTCSMGMFTGSFEIIPS